MELNTKLILTSLSLSIVLSTTSCTNNKGMYQNLETGERITVIKDPETGIAIDSVTKEPINFYVNLETKDTIYGKTGLVVNNSIIKTETGVYKLNDAKIKQDNDEIKIKSEDVKIKVDGDETKIKTENKKIKIEDGETKIKYDN